MLKQYEKPILAVTTFNEEDILTLSGTSTIADIGEDVNISFIDDFKTNRPW